MKANVYVWRVVSLVVANSWSVGRIWDALQAPCKSDQESLPLSVSNSTAKDFGSKQTLTRRLPAQGSATLLGGSSQMPESSASSIWTNSSHAAQETLQRPLLGLMALAPPSRWTPRWGSGWQGRFPSPARRSAGLGRQDTSCCGCVARQDQAIQAESQITPAPVRTPTCRNPPMPARQHTGASVSLHCFVCPSSQPSF